MSNLSLPSKTPFYSPYNLSLQLLISSTWAFGLVDNAPSTDSCVAQGTVMWGPRLGIGSWLPRHALPK